MLERMTKGITGTYSCTRAINTEINFEGGNSGKETVIKGLNKIVRII